MRFGGHETFSIREGWLHKGLALLIEEPEKLFGEFAADWLGVGKNMAKAIRYWLVATGLAEYDQGRRVKSTRLLAPSAIGRIIHQRDRYFTQIGTWWAIHINLVNQPQEAMTWSWFFNTFSPVRFEKTVCTEALIRFLKLSNERMPSTTTIDRDVVCLLRSYARTVPPLAEDPEEALDCPLAELGLVTHFRQSGYYQLNLSSKSIPLELIGYCLAKAFPDVRTDIPLLSAARINGGPGRCFCLTSENLFETLTKAEAEDEEGRLQVVGLAGNRSIRIQQMRDADWLETYYSAVAAGECHVA